MLTTIGRRRDEGRVAGCGAVAGNRKAEVRKGSARLLSCRAIRWRRASEKLSRFASHSAEEAKQAPAGKEVTLGGMLAQLRYKNTKKARNGNSRYLLCVIEDFSGGVKCVMWPDDLAKCKDEVREDVPLFVKGTIDRNQAEPTIVISRLFGLEQAQRELATGLHLLVTLGQHQPRDIEAIGYLLKQTPGNCPVTLTIRDPAQRKCVLRWVGNSTSIPASFRATSWKTCWASAMSN